MAEFRPSSSSSATTSEDRSGTHSADKLFAFRGCSTHCCNACLLTTKDSDTFPQTSDPAQHRQPGLTQESQSIACHNEYVDCMFDRRALNSSSRMSSLHKHMMRCELSKQLQMKEKRTTLLCTSGTLAHALSLFHAL